MVMEEVKGAEEGGKEGGEMARSSTRLSNKGHIP
jgi:hypothetical protein